MAGWKGQDPGLKPDGQECSRSGAEDLLTGRCPGSLSSNPLAQRVPVPKQKGQTSDLNAKATPDDSEVAEGFRTEEGSHLCSASRVILDRGRRNGWTAEETVARLRAHITEHK